MSRLRYILLSVLVVNIFTNYKCIANHNVKSIAVGNALDSRCQLNLSKIAQSVEYIPLDDGGVVDRLLIDEKNLSLKVSDSGDLFIFQRQRGQDILKIFSSTGQFKSSRISYGRGPGEFMNGVKSVAEFDNTLVLLDYCNAIVYRDGEFSRSVRLWDFYPGGIHLHEPEEWNGTYSETDNYLFICVIFPYKGFPNIPQPQRWVPIVYDKVDGKTYSLNFNKKFNANGLVNDIDGGSPFWPQYHIENKLYKFVSASDFIYMASKSSSSKMKAIAVQLTEESNPVLIVVTLK